MLSFFNISAWVSFVHDFDQSLVHYHHCDHQFWITCMYVHMHPGTHTRICVSRAHADAYHHMGYMSCDAREVMMPVRCGDSLRLVRPISLALPSAAGGVSNPIFMILLRSSPGFFLQVGEHIQSSPSKSCNREREGAWVSHGDA